jgi:hypothetical protein
MYSLADSFYDKFKRKPNDLELQIIERDQRLPKDEDELAEAVRRQAADDEAWKNQRDDDERLERQYQSERDAKKAADEAAVEAAWINQRDTDELWERLYQDKRDNEKIGEAWRAEEAEAESVRRKAEKKAADAEKAKELKRKIGDAAGSVVAGAGRVAAAGFNPGAGAWEWYNKNHVRPADTADIEKRTQGYMSAGYDHLAATHDDNTHLEGKGLPTPVVPGAGQDFPKSAGKAGDGGAAGSAEWVPYITSVNQARMFAGEQAARYVDALDAESRALKFKTENMASDLTSQGRQLAASVQNESPYQQRFKLQEWIDKLNANQAYSPMADGITPEEREARTLAVNAAARAFSGEVQRNSLEQQKSQSLADAETRAQAVLAGIGQDAYDDNMGGAYEDALKSWEQARRYLTPQQFQAVVTRQYGAVAEAASGKIVSGFLEGAGGKPVYGETLQTILSETAAAAGYGAGYAGWMLKGKEGDDAAAAEAAEAALAVGLLAEGIPEAARKRVRDYNKGILDARQEEFAGMLESGRASAAAGMAETWRANRSRMASGGAISGEQQNATKNYFKIKDGGESGHGIATALTKDIVQAMSLYVSTNGMSGTNPEDGLLLARDRILEAARSNGENMTGAEAIAKAAATLVGQWEKINDFEGMDIVSSTLKDLNKLVTDHLATITNDKQKPEKNELIDLAYAGFVSNLFLTGAANSGKGVKDRVSDYAGQFLETLQPFWDVVSKMDYPKGDADSPARDMTAVGKYMNGLKDAAARLHIDPALVLANSPATDDAYGAAAGSVKNALNNYFKGNSSGGDPQTEIEYDHERNCFTASVHIVGAGNGAVTSEGGLYALDFKNGQMIVRRIDPETGIVSDNAVATLDEHGEVTKPAAPTRWNDGWDYQYRGRRK